MPDPSISLQSYAGGRPPRDRFLPSWIINYFSRGRASSSAPVASSAIASSNTAPGGDSGGRQPHLCSPASTLVTSPSASPSPGKRPGLRERLSILQLYRRLSRVLAPSSRGSQRIPTRSAVPEVVPDALQLPPSSSTDDMDPGPPPNSLPSPTATTLEVTAPSTDAEDAIIHTSTACIDVADPMAEMWAEAVGEWQLKTGLDLAVPDAIPLRSKEAVMNYIAKMEEENGFEKGEWETLRERVDPLAHILEKLCNPIGDTISAAFPPSNIIFAAVGLIVSAYTRTREDFAQIGDAFHEMRFHLQVVETVADSHPCDVLRTACVLLLIKVLSVLGVIAEMRREGYLRKPLPLPYLEATRPLSEALQNLRMLATNQQQMVAAVTLNKVTQLMESIASDKVSQEWICGCLVDVLRAIRESHDLGSSTQAEVNAHRTALRRMELVLYDQSEKLRKIDMSAECEQIKGWLKYVDPSYRLRKLLDDRAEGTGSWFLDGDEFAALKEGKTKAVLLSGKAGSGKSTIIAAAVEALRAYHACDPHSLVLVHVFDSTNATSGQRDLHALLSTLLCQLALNNTHCASIISEAHKKIVANGLPTKTRMEGLLMETLRATSLHITVVVDALDESSDEEDIVSFIRRLEAMSAIIVLASRRPVIGSTPIFGVVISMDNHVKNNDIGLFLDLAMAQGSNLGKMQSDRKDMRAKLLAGAEGK
ncbi:uncharacterized protein SCHCODRAFT_02508259 [Schizophyllum commune H4-8]|nr:uncharacterized protein SCHCODRAFT_02508259 [Schizophyllum commune H4-8]KAI5889878.1 hypothetical protein SCHCODRAFT_02508259 [Schizophyllum commune H4-8]